ncbi:uncharacterized protein UHOD_11431 [Ustilago sp. UG-2017b]|nr:uncharacterized protein UHOD_11431 [Ustilago sp. UG-2017b]
MVIWDNSMPEPAVTLAFTSMMTNTIHPHRPYNKADLWHQRLGHASHDSIMRTQAVTLSHNIPSTPATNPGVLCNVCICSKAITKNVAHPRRVQKPLELVPMDVMGPLHGDTKFAYALIIHDAYSGMSWAQGLASKGEASQEAAWCFSEMCVTMHQKLSEIIIDHGIRGVRVDQGECHGTRCAGSRKNRKSYEEERRNHRIGKNEGLRQSSSRSVVERLYDRFRPNRSHNKTDVEDIGFATLMKQGAHSTMNSEQEDGQDERGVQVVTQMKWEWPLLVMKQHEDFPSTRSKGSSANERCHKAGRTVRRESQRGGGAV